ncbi:uncharacterized protein M421DRAFT_297808 [Didymella exigua CBS 183.55]|uniref:Uncharacterized protein n=1 Tax=Didymella exigua CBS 183.55 TaxID=1150837 RepID=A0A6A5RBQ1_9PLEO|nr:uncharacterized protein M421DRAFT_297808 [Didymella exigua CBS 183.55]KAF1924086.1 hypothetical protein M421DRAFT_297808 [Didymella exigua CBS 183.55]
MSVVVVTVTACGVRGYRYGECVIACPVSKVVRGRGDGPGSEVLSASYRRAISEHQQAISESTWVCWSLADSLFAVTNNTTWSIRQASTVVGVQDACMTCKTPPS